MVTRIESSTWCPTSASKEWDNPSEVRQLLSDLEKEEAQIHLVNCVRTQRANLAITDLKPTEETRASGVPLFMNVEITNFGDTAAENVQLKIRTYFYASDVPASGEQPASGWQGRRIAHAADRTIEPGETVTQRVQVFFPESGKHVVEAILPEDSVAADNRRWCVVEFPDQESVLVVDGDPSQRNAFYIEAIFQPGQRARTGIRPDMQTTCLLARHDSRSPAPLQRDLPVRCRSIGRSSCDEPGNVRSGRGGPGVLRRPAGEHRLLQ